MNFENNPHGPDVSKWNIEAKPGEDPDEKRQVDWSLISAHADFGIARCAYGIRVDDKWYYNRSHAENIDFPFMGYGWCLPDVNVKKQARLCAQLTADLPVFWMDAERRPGDHAIATATQFEDFRGYFMDEAEKISGRWRLPVFGWYTNAGSWIEVKGDRSFVKGDPLWVAATLYDDDGRIPNWPNGPLPLYPWDDNNKETLDWKLWQYTWRKKHPGIDGGSDDSIYKGTKLGLYIWMRKYKHAFKHLYSMRRRHA